MGKDKSDKSKTGKFNFNKFAKTMWPDEYEKSKNKPIQFFKTENSHELEGKVTTYLRDNSYRVEKFNQMPRGLGDAINSLERGFMSLDIEIREVKGKGVILYYDVTTTMPGVYLASVRLLGFDKKDSIYRKIKKDLEIFSKENDSKPGKR